MGSGLGEPEIDDAGARRVGGRVEQDVVGLEVAMAEATLVRVLKALGQSDEDPHEHGQVVGALVEKPTQRSAVDQLHRDPHPIVKLARVVHREQVRVLNPGDRTGLVEHALAVARFRLRPHLDVLERNFAP